jgi:hypothetical protein
MKVDVKKRGGGYCAHLEPMDGVYIGAAGPTAATALHQASRLLSLAIDRPEVAAVLPPGTIAAVKILRGATAAIRRGQLTPYLRAMTPRRAREVARTLRRVLSW